MEATEPQQVFQAKWKLIHRGPGARSMSNPNLVSLEHEENSHEVSWKDGLRESRRFPPDSLISLPPAKKEANAEVYGFVGWVASFFAFVLYLAWAYLPNSVLEEIGVSYYPDKWWAIAFPAYFCVSLMFFIWGGYLSINLLATPPLNSFDYFTPFEEGTEGRNMPVEGGIAPICDIPLTRINQLLYSRKTKKHKKNRSSQLFGNITDEEEEEKRSEVK